MSTFMDKIKALAAADKKTIVLAEGEERRTVQAADAVLKQGFADIILLGNEAKIKEISKDLDISGARIIDPATSELTEDFANKLYELRKAKGMTPEKAAETILNTLYFGCMLVKTGMADGMVAGAVNSTANVLRSALQIIKTAPDTKVVSAFFLMIVPDCEYGENGTFVFSDCGLNEYPDEEKLAQIALSSAKSFRMLVGEEPKVAMLSYSSYGSAKSEYVDKVRNATELVKAQAPDLKIDGELQLDAAIVPEINASKAPGSPIEGKANVLIFPNLDAGNIGYKLVQRLAKAEAYGPLTQGIAKPVNDLSRGCSYEDIVGVVAFTCVQAQKQA
ncbi:phosphate acetyltransferase [Ructibacterium gallinarum]|uniref:Phosphate acetyltransferase n=1 Tax=Ructibacterium gallinarum TaxID=2779355 RepID=A0A9D5R897_9FIRM|nr:phosphate acetyltransferase [Ructibacterium gallinarum]MBE5039732.1 phosphate acetyltransferase [Ructibacterium gallinarum]